MSSSPDQKKPRVLSSRNLGLPVGVPHGGEVLGKTFETRPRQIVQARGPSTLRSKRLWVVTVLLLLMTGANLVMVWTTLSSIEHYSASISLSQYAEVIQASLYLIKPTNAGKTMLVVQIPKSELPDNIVSDSIVVSIGIYSSNGSKFSSLSFSIDHAPTSQRPQRIPLDPGIWIIHLRVTATYWSDFLFVGQVSTGRSWQLSI